jgi:hypothetical protein
MPRTLPCPFFKAWSSEMAYVLGYWFADGNMYNQPSCASYVVSIGSKDLEHLKQLRSTIGMGKLTRITGSDVYKLVICRKEMFDDLLRLGGTERKSLTLAWPEVPLEYLAHFTRGYVDGDGSLIWHKPGASMHPLLSIAGTERFLTGIGQAVQDETGIPMPTRHRHGDSGHLCVMNWYGMQAKCVIIWLYHIHHGLCLHRKMVLASEFADWQPKVFDPSHVTSRMWQLFERYLP